MFLFVCVAGDYRDLKLPPSTCQQVADLLRNSPEFTISAWLKQEVGNTGSIVSFAHGVNRYLEVQSSGRKNEIRLHYTSRVDSKVYVETFHYKLADDAWHHVALSVSGSQAELLVDCHPLYKRLLRPGAPDRNFTQIQQLWLGQRNKHYHFKVREINHLRLNFYVTNVYNSNYPVHKKKQSNNVTKDNKFYFKL